MTGPRPATSLSAPTPLLASHAVDAFDRGDPLLNDWLKRRALRNESRFSRTYVVCDGGRVVAFHCISAGGVQREAAPGKVRRNAPDTVPVAVIGRLAVDRAHAGRGLGADMLADALRRIATASPSIGIAAVLVQAKDARAGLLYGVCGVHRVSGGEPDVVPADRDGGGGVRMRDVGCATRQAGRSGRRRYNLQIIEVVSLSKPA